MHSCLNLADIHTITTVIYTKELATTSFKFTQDSLLSIIDRVRKITNTQALRKAGLLDDLIIHNS